MNFVETPTNRLLTTTEAAEFLGVKPSSLTVWRCTRKVKIPFVRIGANVRYRTRDLEKFLESHSVEG